MTDQTGLRVAGLHAELRTDAPHVATPTPRLSWTTRTDGSDWMQQRVELELDGDASSRTILEGDASVLVPWPFAPLRPRERRTLRARVTGQDGDRSPWSEPLSIVAAFLGDGEWTASWVGLAHPLGHAQPALLRRELTIPPGLTSATITATAMGAFTLEVDGRRIDDDVLSPGWTSYPHRVIHETFDVTAELTPGTHALGAHLAGAWYTEAYGPTDDAHVVYGDQPAFALQLELEFEDGRRQTITTDETWRSTAEGPLISSGIYAGERYDARRDLPGWSTVGFEDAAWDAVGIVPGPEPEARVAPPVRAIEELAAVQVIRDPDGAQILDFGQNLVGRLRLTVDGEAGRTVTLRHAEVLENGRLGTRPLRSAAATDQYTLRGGGPEVWEPRFTFHGFRYAQIDGWPGELDPADVTAVVLHTDMRRTGWFETSHPLLDRLHENVVWGMRGNFLAIPTDCPQRDERLGWTGDIQVFAPTASFLYDSHAFIESWMRDVGIEQRLAGGVVPLVVPSVLPDPPPVAAWGDAATIVPTVLRERFGDHRTLAEHFDGMCAWVDLVSERRGDDGLWRGDPQLGDWLDPMAPPDRPSDSRTDPDIVANAYLYRSAALTAEAARALGRLDDELRYTALAEQTRDAFRAAFLSDDLAMSSDTQTAYALAIVFALVDPQEATRMSDRLAALVSEAGYRIGTGFVGTPIVTEALSRTGQLHIAARLLLQTEMPSWLYPVTMGATTIWERWDSMRPDGSINPGEMTSFNHYALGAVADWMHRVVAGLAPAEAGYRVVTIAPRPVEGLADARATLDTPYGRAITGWRREGDDIVVDAVVPPNARGRVQLQPGGAVFEIGSGRYEWRVQVQEQLRERGVTAG